MLFAKCSQWPNVAKDTCTFLSSKCHHAHCSQWATLSINEIYAACLSFKCSMRYMLIFIHIIFRDTKVKYSKCQEATKKNQPTPIYKNHHGLHPKVKYKFGFNVSC